MSAEEDREPISAVRAGAGIPAGAVFLSYASEDAAAAERIATALRSGGIEVWFDKSELRGGDAWDRKIREQIHDCHLFIPVISANSERRDEGYFRREWSLAADRTRDMAHKRAFLLPVVIDGTPERGASVPEKFHELQWTRLPGGETPLAFVERLRKLLSPAEPDEPPKAAPPPPILRAGAQPAASRLWPWKPLLPAAVAALALVALGYLVLNRMGHSKATAQVANSIAVLPLANESGDPSQQYFSDGISEDLITALSQFPSLKVIGRTSSFQFRNSKEDSHSIGAKLGVAHLLEGSVRRSGDLVRVSAELINAEDGSAQWSERYDRPYKDLFALQDEITRAVAGALRAKLLPGERAAAQSEQPPSGNLEAYNALLQGRFFAIRGTEADQRKAIEFYTQATQLDPRYALAWSELSSAWTALGQAFLTGPPMWQAFAKAREAVSHALALSPELATAHVAQGYLFQVADLNWRGAEAEFRRAMELAPNSGEAKFSLGTQLAGFGEVEAAIELTRQAIAIDPLKPDRYELLSSYFSGLNRLDEAERAIRRAIELQPASAVFHWGLAVIEIQRGNAQAALDAAQQETGSEQQDVALALARQIGSDRVAADAALRTLIEKDPTSAFEIAEVYALRNDPKETFEWLDRAFNNRETDIGTVLYDPFILRYKDDPRFAAFCRKVGLPTPAEAAGRT
jgi:TolB-like protein/Tfp pilus assembly protein PilF